MWRRAGPVDGPYEGTFAHPAGGLMGTIVADVAADGDTTLTLHGGDQPFDWSWHGQWKEGAMTTGDPSQRIDAQLDHGQVEATVDDIRFRARLAEFGPMLIVHGALTEHGGSGTFDYIVYRAHGLGNWSLIATPKP